MRGYTLPYMKKKIRIRHGRGCYIGIVFSTRKTLPLFTDKGKRCTNKYAYVNVGFVPEESYMYWSQAFSDGMELLRRQANRKLNFKK